MQVSNYVRHMRLGVVIVETGCQARAKPMSSVISNTLRYFKTLEVTTDRAGTPPASCYAISHLGFMVAR